MTRRTIAQKLISYESKVREYEEKIRWWETGRGWNQYMGRGMPLPTLPEIDYLRGKYLEDIRRSEPERVSEIMQAIEVVDRVRRGKVQYRPSARTPEGI